MGDLEDKNAGLRNGISRSAWKSEVVRLPPHFPGMRIGLFGGSFNPPHSGHQLVAARAHRQLDLHAIWWLITPGNPHKPDVDLAKLSERLSSVRTLFGSKIVHRALDVESRWRLVYTADTIAKLRASCRGVRFVWLMGADNLRFLHTWQRWRDITSEVPIAVVDRSGETCTALNGRFATEFRHRRLRGRSAGRIFDRSLPRWAFLGGKRVHVSSSDMRGRGMGGRGV